MSPNEIEVDDVQNNPVITTETPEQKKYDYDEISESAMDLLKSGNPQGAYDSIKEHLEGGGSEHPKMWTVAGGSLARIDRMSDAIAAFSKSVVLDPKNAQAWYNLGVLQEKSGDVKSATNSVMNAIQIDESYEKAATKLVEYGNVTGDIGASLDGMKALLKINPQHNCRLEFAKMLIEIGEGEEKVMQFVRELPITLPEGPELAKDALNHLNANNGLVEGMLVARAQTLTGDISEAISMWKNMLTLDKNNKDIWNGLATSLDAAGESDAAAKCRNKAGMLDVSGEKLDEANEVFANTTTSEEKKEEPEKLAEPENDKMNELLSTPVEQPKKEVIVEENPQVDLAMAALDAAQRSTQVESADSNSNSVSNQDVEWFNKGIGLMGDEKYREALSCFDRALPSFRDNDAMVIKILNSRGDALYGLEKYPECIDSYHKAMLINPKSVEGRILYNMGVAYAELKRFPDAIKCFEQAIGRGLLVDQVKIAKEQIRRCKKLMK